MSITEDIMKANVPDKRCGACGGLIKGLFRVHSFEECRIESVNQAFEKAANIADEGHIKDWSPHYIGEKIRALMTSAQGGGK